MAMEGNNNNNNNNYGMMDLHYAMVMLGGGGDGIPFGSDSKMGMVSAASSLSGESGGGLDMEIGGRWPKEETLALLEIRTRLDSKFKEANHKGHLWNEVSRIMCVEHGYKRSGKKCSEKFENLYKYYKKIKDGKVGRQDKIQNYRFFHQLEAISCGSSNTNPISVTNAASRPTPPPPFVEDDNHLKKRMMGKKHWQTKITDFIEARINTLTEKQDKWMEKVMHTIEEKEKERISKEIQWRKEEAARLEREKKIRSSERARMEHRHAALMEALHKLTRNEPTIESRISGPCVEYCNDQDQIVTSWGENETTQLIQLRSNMETRFEKLGDQFMEDVLWEDIALTMASLGYNRNALMCKAKWDHISFLLRNKRQKGCSNWCYDHHHNHIFHQTSERLVRFNDQQSDHNEMMLRNFYGKIKEG